MAMTEGLRARKKRATREAISAAAKELFADRGYDAVTVAEVARAADVAEKTVFNYFPAKEDLVFTHREDRFAALATAFELLPAGAPVSGPFRAGTRDFLRRVATEPVEEVIATPRLVMASPTLRDRLFILWEQDASALAPRIARALGRPADDLVGAVVARTLTGAHRQVFRTAIQRLVRGDDPQVVAAELGEQAEAAYDLLDRGLATDSGH